MIKESAGFAGSLPNGALLSCLSIWLPKSPVNALGLRLSVIAADARSIEAKAWEMRHALRVRRPDYTAVHSTLADLTCRVHALGEAVRDLRDERSTWASASSEYALILEMSQTLQAYVQAKGDLLDSPAADKSRRILSAKATGIALRASMLHRRLTTASSSLSNNP